MSISTPVSQLTLLMQQDGVSEATLPVAHIVQIVDRLKLDDDVEFIMNEVLRPGRYVVNVWWEDLPVCNGEFSVATKAMKNLSILYGNAYHLSTASKKDSIKQAATRIHKYLNQLREIMTQGLYAYAQKRDINASISKQTWLSYCYDLSTLFLPNHMSETSSNISESSSNV